MNRQLPRIYSYEEYHEKLKQTREGHRAMPDEASELAARKIRTSDLAELTLKSRHEKLRKQRPEDNEVYHTVQALLLAFSVLALSCHGVLYGRSEYSLLQNGQMVNGFIPAHRAVVTLSLGYSVSYSLLSSVAACMLLYSLVSKKPRWSLPSIILYMADLVCDVGDAIMASWLFFGNLRLATAIFYIVGITSVIMAEVWIWLGVLRLYENRTFK